MLQVEVSFGRHRGYQDSAVRLHGRPLAFAFVLSAGEHSFRSGMFDIGTLQDGRELLAYVAFGYAYDQDEGTVTVCGSDYRSRDTMTLVTVPRGSSDYGSHPAASGVPTDDPVTAGDWRDQIPFAPGLEEALRELAISASEALIAALQLAPGLNIEVLRHPPDIPAADAYPWHVVYRSGAFLELYEPGRLYGPQDRIVHINSVYKGTVKLGMHRKFANVIGSTRDPKVKSKTWISLWTLYSLQPAPTRCTSFQYNNFPCNTKLVGGHIIMGKTAKIISAGSSKVRIIPICIRHNNNDHVFMEARWNGPVAILLAKYLQK